MAAIVAELLAISRNLQNAENGLVDEFKRVVALIDRHRAVFWTAPQRSSGQRTLPAVGRGGAQGEKIWFI